MQEEKKYLEEEVGSWLGQSDYVFLTDFTGITVAQTEALRLALAEQGAEFHVVKNRIFKRAATQREMPDLGEHLKGPTAIVVGGDNAPGVAKALEKFLKDSKKMEIKGGVLENSLLSTSDISELAKLPPAEVLQAQLLGLFNQPATMLVRVVQAVPQGLLNVLQAKADEGSEA